MTPAKFQRNRSMGTLGPGPMSKYIENSIELEFTSDRLTFDPFNVANQDKKYIEPNLHILIFKSIPCACILGLWLFQNSPKCVPKSLNRKMSITHHGYSWKTPTLTTPLILNVQYRLLYN